MESYSPMHVTLYSKGNTSCAELLSHLRTLVKSADFFARPQIVHLKCVKCSSDSKYATYKPKQ